MGKINRVLQQMEEASQWAHERHMEALELASQYPDAMSVHGDEIHLNVRSIGAPIPKEIINFVVQDMAPSTERRVLKAMAFSETYRSKPEPVAPVNPEQVRKLTMDYLQAFPATMNMVKLTKSRTRMMVQAVQEGESVKGNQRVVYMPNSKLFHFFYRGTEIAFYSPQTGVSSDVNADGYEETASTRNQRKQIAEAVKEFKNMILKESN